MAPKAPFFMFSYINQLIKIKLMSFSSPIPPNLDKIHFCECYIWGVFSLDVT